MYVSWTLAEKLYYIFIIMKNARESVDNVPGRVFQGAEARDCTCSRQFVRRGEPVGSLARDLG